MEILILGAVLFLILGYVLGHYAGEQKGKADVYEHLSETEAEREDES